MRIYLSEGSLMDISWLGNGDTEVNIVCPPKTYTSFDEKMKDKQAIAQEALAVLRKNGITSGGGKGKPAKPLLLPYNPQNLELVRGLDGQIKWVRTSPPHKTVAQKHHIVLHKNQPPENNGYKWNPFTSQELAALPPVKTYGVTPTPMTANENNTENFPNNASSQLRYQPYIVQPDATSHASLAPQNVPSEASKSDIPNIKDLSEGLKNFPTLGEAISTIVGDESLANKFKIGGDVIAGATDAYSLFTAKSIDEKIEAFGKTAKHVAEWWASREIPVVGEGLLARDIGIMLYNGVRYVDTK